MFIGIAREEQNGNTPRPFTRTCPNGAATTVFHYDLDN